MPLFDIEFVAKETVHQRQLIQVEADTVEEAIAAVENYEIDNSQATTLGHPSFTEWLVDDVKAHSPEEAAHAFLPGAIADAKVADEDSSLRFLVKDIVFAHDGRKVDLPTEMVVKIPASTPDDERHDRVVEAVSDETGWLVESLEVFAIEPTSAA
jgi:hypothetical protein